MAKNRDNTFSKYKTFNILNPIQNSLTDGIFKMSITSMEKYKSNLYTLIFTGIGERLLMPDFGTRLRQLLFEPITDRIFSEIDRDIKRQVEMWIPQIIIDKIDFGDIEDNTENNRIQFNIYFHLKADPTLQDFIEIEMGI